MLHRSKQKALIYGGPPSMLLQCSTSLRGVEALKGSITVIFSLHIGPGAVSVTAQ
jgi:hypothetical protein